MPRKTFCIFFAKFGQKNIVKSSRKKCKAQRSKRHGAYTSVSRQLKERILLLKAGAANKGVQVNAAQYNFALFFAKFRLEKAAKSLRKKAQKLNAKSGTALYTCVSRQLKERILLLKAGAANKGVQVNAAQYNFALFFAKFRLEKAAKSLRKKAQKLNAKSGTALYTCVSRQLKERILLLKAGAANKGVQVNAAQYNFALFFAKFRLEKAAKSLRKKAQKLNAKSGTALYTCVSCYLR